MSKNQLLSLKKSGKNETVVWDIFLNGEMHVFLESILKNYIEIAFFKMVTRTE